MALVAAEHDPWSRKRVIAVCLQHGVTGILALGAHSDAETKLGTRGVKAADIEAAHSKTATLALVTDVLGGAAIVMGGVTIVLAATSGKSRVDAAKPAAALLLSPRGALLTGRF